MPLKGHSFVVPFILRGLLSFWVLLFIVTTLGVRAGGKVGLVSVLSRESVT